MDSKYVGLYVQSILADATTPPQVVIDGCNHLKSSLVQLAIDMAPKGFLEA